MLESVKAAFEEEKRYQRELGLKCTVDIVLMDIQISSLSIALVGFNTKER